MRMLALVGPLALVACAHVPAPLPEQTPSPWENVGVRVVDGVPQLDEVEIELARSRFRGWCPIYSVKLSGDGTLSYAGKSYVKARGTHCGTFDPQQLLPLLEICQELELLDRDHRCYAGAIDNPHAFVTLRIGPRTRSVEDRFVRREHLPFSPSAEEVRWHRKMVDLEQAIDALADIESWIGTAAEREAHREDWR